MLKQVIKGWTRVLGAPPDWKPDTHGECMGLPVRISPYAPDGTVMCESAWEPTPQELEWLNNGGKLILRVIGGQPPVALYVDPP